MIGKKRSIPSSPLIELLIKVQGMIHPWIRVNRIIRDIPGLYITAGNDREDLRAILDKEIENRGLPPCKCIRSREVRDEVVVQEPELVVREYEASYGKELFISFEINDRKTILGFLRLRIPGEQSLEKIIFPELQGCALMRELHVYGVVVPVSSSANDTGLVNQHIGYGKRLIKEAERLAKLHGFYKIAVIAGVGVRNYYRKLGYHDADSHGFGNFQIKQLEYDNDHANATPNATTIATPNATVNATATANATTNPNPNANPNPNDLTHIQDSLIYDMIVIALCILIPLILSHFLI
jgi:ELP3 family radical SAM enzyme/protein acetyltransferase